MKVIDKSRKSKCRACNGEGIIFHWKEFKGKLQQEFFNCEICNGTGLFKDSHYLLITEKDGQKIAFDMDTLK